MIPVGVYGWQKGWLYCAMVLVTILAVLNIGLLVWMVHSLRIDGSGAGPVSFRGTSVRIDGDLTLTEGLTVNQILYVRSRNGRPC
jgi:hypothetical protein